MVTERERVMMSAPNAELYQTPCIRNPRLDDAVYGNGAPIQEAKIRLRRAYVVAGVLIVVSLITAVVPAVYVVSTSASRSDGNGGGGSDTNWTVCWPCRTTSTRMCCATLAKSDLRCSTVTSVLFHCCH